MKIISDACRSPRRQGVRDDQILPLLYGRLGDERSSWLPMAILILVFAGQAVTVCPVKAQATLPPENMSKLEAAAVRLYDDVGHDDCASGMEQLALISKAAEPVISRLDGTSAPLTKAIIRSFRAVKQHDHIAALHSANKIREWTDLKIASTRPDTPPEVARLGYLARELQIESVEDRHKKMAARVLEVRQCWDQLKPVLEKIGAPVLLKDGETVLHQLELADSPDAFRQVLVPLSQWVDRISQEFDGTKH